MIVADFRLSISSLAMYIKVAFIPYFLHFVTMYILIFKHSFLVIISFYLKRLDESSVNLKYSILKEITHYSLKPFYNVVIFIFHLFSII